MAKKNKKKRFNDLDEEDQNGYIEINMETPVDSFLPNNEENYVNEFTSKLEKYKKENPEVDW